tara:strand:+ start:147228 stop:148373 length:1146 start_codon:yes stop_codon:yes gene_type:complete
MDSIIDKIVKSLHGRLSSEEEKTLKDWVAQSEVNRKLYQKISRLQEAHSLQKIEKFDIDGDWKVVESSYKSRKRVYNRFYIKTAVAAAILVGIIFTGITLYNSYKVDHINTTPSIVLSNGSQVIKEINSDHTTVFNTSQKVIATQTDNTLSYESSTGASNDYHTLHIPNGENFTVILSDSTLVHLNAGSTLQYPVSFTSKEKRSVTLTGEAYFDVKKDTTAPFIVQTNKVDVTVLGTEFNVNAYPEDLQTNIALVEGAVKLDSKTASFSTKQLKPNQVATLTTINNNLSISTTNLTPYLSWRDGRLILQEDPFNVIIKKLERKYNVSINNSYSELDNKTFTATLSNESIEEVMKAFKLSYPFEFTIDKHTQTININKPKKE